MTANPDDRIAERLREDAPPARDGLFRLSVLERREQQRYRQRSLMLGGAGIGMAGLIGVCVGVGASPLVVACVAALAGALGVSAVLAATGVRQIMQRLRAMQRTTAKS